MLSTCLIELLRWNQVAQRMLRSGLLSWGALGFFTGLCFVQNLFYTKALCEIDQLPYRGVVKDFMIDSNPLVGFRLSLSSRQDAWHIQNPFAVDLATRIAKGSIVITQNESVVVICETSVKNFEGVFAASDHNVDGWLDIYEIHAVRSLFGRTFTGADLSALTLDENDQISYDAYSLFCTNLSSSLGWLVPCDNKNNQWEENTVPDYPAHAANDVSDWLALHDIVAISTTYHVPYLGYFNCQSDWPLLSAAIWLWVFEVVHLSCFTFVVVSIHFDLLVAENSRGVAFAAAIARFIGVHLDSKSVLQYWRSYGIWFTLLSFYFISPEERLADISTVSIRIIQWYVVFLAYAFGEGAFLDFEYMLASGTVRIPVSQTTHRGYIRCPLCYTLCRYQQSFRFRGEAENAPRCLVCTSAPSIMQLQCGHLCVCRACHVKIGSLDGRSHQD